jgi:hypothetical protein
VRLRWGVVLLTVVVVAACSRGPEPPAPTEDLVPTVVGVVQDPVVAPPVSLRGGSTFAPPADAEVERVKNWPARETDEAEGILPNLLLLGGQRPDGSWWYQLAGFRGMSDGCWTVVGGSFDEGDAVQLSSGLVLPKAPDFEIRTHGQDDVQWFPGHQDDSICVDDQGRAVYFDAFVGR